MSPADPLLAAAGLDPTCADPHIHRWHCMRGHDGAPRGVCPLDVCERRGANSDTTPWLREASSR